MASLGRFKRARTNEHNKETLHRFKDRVAIVTGGARGIGRAVAHRIASEGGLVYIMDIFNTQDADASAVHGYCRVDVTDFESVQQSVDAIAAKHGYIDILVQCAGITGKTGVVAHKVETLDFERVWRVNVLGTFNVCKAVVPHMLRASYGRIVNIASISGKEGNPGQSAYASSKGAVIALTKTMGKDYAQTGVIINSLATAVVQTEMVKAMPASQVAMMTSKIPMRRCGGLDEIAAVISFMASEENSFSTGFCFDMTGGRATY